MGDTVLVTKGEAELDSKELTYELFSETVQEFSKMDPELLDITSLFEIGNSVIRRMDDGYCSLPV